MWSVETTLPIFLLVLVRVAAIFLFMPFLNSAYFPSVVKVPLVVLLSWYSAQHLTSPPTLPSSVLGFLGAVVNETAIGYAMSWSLALVFAAVELGAEAVSLQMGFGLGGVFNPETGVEDDVLAQAFSLTASVLFLAFNGHHRLLEALSKSFECLPPGHSIFAVVAADHLLAVSHVLFTVAIALSAPAMASLWLASVGMACVARFLPSVNVFLMDFPIKMAVGFGVIGLSMTRYEAVFQHATMSAWYDMRAVLNLLHG